MTTPEERLKHVALVEFPVICPVCWQRTVRICFHEENEGCICHHRFDMPEQIDHLLFTCACGNEWTMERSTFDAMACAYEKAEKMRPIQLAFTGEDLVVLTVDGTLMARKLRVPSCADKFTTIDDAWKCLENSL